MDFSKSYQEAKDLEKAVQKAQRSQKIETAEKRGVDIRKKPFGVSDEIDREGESAWTKTADETRSLVASDLQGQLKMTENRESPDEASDMVVGRRPLGKKSGEAFALSMNTEFALRPGQLKETVRELLAEIAGIPWVEVTAEDGIAIERIAVELGNNPKIYYHPDQFEVLKQFLSAHAIGVGLSKTKDGKVLEEDLNRASLDLIELLYARFLRKG